MVWGQSLLERNNYSPHKEHTCYAGTQTYDKMLVYTKILYYKVIGYEIIEWKINEMKDFSMEDLKVGMLVKNNYYDEFGYGLIMPSKRNGIAIIYKDKRWGDISFSDITEVWGYCNYVFEALNFDFCRRELLYERKEPKKMTVKEICEELGYDVEIVKE